MTMESHAEQADTPDAPDEWVAGAGGDALPPTVMTQDHT